MLHNPAEWLEFYQSIWEDKFENRKRSIETKPSVSTSGVDSGRI